MIECEDRCPRECKHSQYIVSDVRTMKQEQVKESYEDTGSKHFWVKHNNYPDIDIKHVPHLTWISFVCNMGGLLGMWLGVSILATIENLAYFPQKLKYIVNRKEVPSQTKRPLFIIIKTGPRFNRH